MKKILFVCDGDHFSTGAMDFISTLNAKERLLVKAVFYAPIDFQQLIPVSYIPVAAPYARLKSKEHELVEKSRKLFSDYCKTKNIQFETVAEQQEWNAEFLTTETRFADLLVISEQILFSDFYVEQPNIFMKELLRSSECPVMVVPEIFETPERLVIAYDGKQECMFALKQFCYLFPEWTKLPTEIVFTKNDKEETIPQEKLLNEFAKTHFENLKVKKLHFKEKSFFAAWTSVKENCLVVAGSFGRSAFSELMKTSFVNEIIQEHKMPLFIAHL